MTNNVFFNAVDATVKTQLNNKVIGYSATAEELRALLEGYAVTLNNTTFIHSSDVDFASEEGFVNDDAAHELIEAALAQL